MSKHPVGTIYKVGQKQDIEKPTRVDLVRVFARAYQSSISLRLDALLSKGLHEMRVHGVSDRVAEFIRESMDCIDQVLKLKNGITTSSKRRVDFLEESHGRFKVYLMSQHSILAHPDSTVLDELNLLLEDCLHFVNQFKMTYSLVWDLSSMPNRPTDRDLKGKFLRAIIAYQERNDTDKFPSYSVICKMVEMSPMRFSERRYRDWKRQLKNHTFHLFRQPKKPRKAAVSSLKAVA